MIARDRKLSDDAQRLADDPAHIAQARRIADGWIRKLPRLRDDIESAALLGLCEAARTFDPSLDHRFLTHAQNRIVGAIKDDLRRQGIIRGRRHTKAPKVESLDLPLEGRDGLTFASVAETIAAAEHPVGWEQHSQDGVAELTAGLPHQHKRAIRLFYGDCRTPTMKRVGREMGLSESRVSKLISGGFDMIRGVDGVATMVADGHPRLATGMGYKPASPSAQPAVPAEPVGPGETAYHGVSWIERRRKWAAKMSLGGKQTTIGVYDTAIEAARAYDAKRVAAPFFGPKAPALNFPDEHPADWLERCREIGGKPGPRKIAAEAITRHAEPVPAASPPRVVAPPAGSEPIMPPPPVASVAVTTDGCDREVAAIVALSAALNGLERAEVARVLRWATDRFASESVPV